MTTKEFIEKLNQEDGVAILEKIQAAGKNPDAVYSIAKEAGVTDSFDVFKAEMTALYEAITQDLTEEELANIAGGLSELAISAIGFGGTSVICFAAIAAVV